MEKYMISSNLMSKITILLLFFSYSCQNKQDNSIDGKSSFLINVDVKNAKNLDYKEWFEDYIIVSLETKDESLIGEIGKIYVTNSYIIIFDTKESKIKLFNTNGDYLYNIGKKGSGPNEYLFFNDIYFDPNTQLIYAHERFQNRIFVYDLSGSFYMKSETAEYGFNSFCKTESNFWIYSCLKNPNNPNGYNIMFLNEDLQKQESAFFPQKEFINTTYSSIFTCDEQGNPYFVYPTSNSIYKISKNIPDSYIKLDFGNKTMPYERIKKMSNYGEYEDLVADKKYIGGLRNLFVYNDFYCISFNESGFNISVNNYNCFITPDKEIAIFDNAFFARFDFPVMTQPLGMANNSVIYASYPYMYSDNNIREFEKFTAKKIDTESNPILVFMTLKNNIFNLTNSGDCQ